MDVPDRRFVDEDFLDRLEFGRRGGIVLVACPDEIAFTERFDGAGAEFALNRRASGKAGAEIVDD